jgi:hypothetical protein
MLLWPMLGEVYPRHVKVLARRADYLPGAPVQLRRAQEIALAATPRRLRRQPQDVSTDGAFYLYDAVSPVQTLFEVLFLTETRSKTLQHFGTGVRDLTTHYARGDVV